MKKQIISEEFKRMQKLAGVLNENESPNENEDPIEKAFNASPDELPWNTIEQAFEESGLSGEEFFAGAENEFREKFEDELVSREAYLDFFTNLPTAMGQEDWYGMVNWISFTNPKLADELYSTI